MKGSISVGKQADFVVYELKGKSKSSKIRQLNYTNLYKDEEFYGNIVKVFIRGKEAYTHPNGKIL